jgi:DNA-binding NarL/FixJ family response regulator
VTIAVFIADDHAVVREGLVFVLNAEPDISVVGQAEDGESAVRSVSRLAPDVAVLDIAMPGLSGVGASRRIRDACPGTQVVILSMHSSEAYISQALKAGARGYVLKECAGSELVRAVRTVHAGHSYLSPRVSDKMLERFTEEEDESAQGPLAALSDREREVFHLVVEGQSSAEIGEILCLSPKTIETYRSRLMHKLGVDDFLGLVKFAARHKLISLD